MSQQVPNQGGYPPPQGPYVQQQPQQAGYNNGGGNDFAAQAARFNRDHIASPETKEFFKTSEFLLWGLVCLGVLIASAVAPDVLDATGAWGLITTLSIAYMVSRGLAKAGTHRADWNYSEHGNHTDNAFQAQVNEHVSTPETKEFFKTSEFVVWGLTVFGLLIASAVVDIFDTGAAWRYITFATAGYIVSRGLSKIGTRADSHSRRGRPVESGYTSGPGMMVPAAPMAQPAADTVDLRSPAQPVTPSGHVPPQQQGY